MRLNYILITIVILSLTAATLFMWPITYQSLHWGFLKLSEDQTKNLREVLNDSIEQKRSFLRNLSHIVQSDANLASSFILAQSSGDSHLLNEMINDFKIRSNVQSFFIIPADPKLALQTNSDKCLRTLLEKHQEEGFCENEYGTMIASLTNLELYGEKAGTLFIAASLVPPEEKNKAKTQHFELITTKSPNTVEISKIGDTAIYAFLTPDLTILQHVTSTLGNRLAFGIGLSLIFMLILSAFLLEFLFLRPFKNIVNSLNTITSHLEQDRITDFKPVKTWIFENRRLLSALGLFVSKIKEFEVRLKESNAKVLEVEKKAALGELSRQLAHDIRSPLAALKIAAGDREGISDSNRQILVAAADRINNVANELLAGYRNPLESEIFSSANSLTFLYLELDAVVSEKRTLVGNTNFKIELTYSQKALFSHARISSQKIQRVLSNLLDNAIEAILQSGSITIHLDCNLSESIILIKDNGKGIPPEILLRLGKDELSFGKSSGSGIGVSSAFQIVAAAGGKINIRSQVDVGTEVEIRLPYVSPPEWMATSVDVSLDRGFVVIDDDKSVHEIWRHRLNELSLNSTVLITHMIAPADFETWYRAHSDTHSYQYFVDYEFHGSRQNGLDLIENFRLKDHAILVTAHYTENNVTTRVKHLGVKMLPKSLLSAISIHTI